MNKINVVLFFQLSLTEKYFPVEDEIKQGCLVTSVDSLQTMFKDISQVPTSCLCHVLL